MIDHKTTALNDDLYRPLEVKWNLNSSYEPDAKGTLHPVAQPIVTLIEPGMLYLTPRTRVYDFTPEEALNLLNWLRQEEPLLQALVQKDATFEKEVNNT